jgi:hypothetical protein
MMKKCASCSSVAPGKSRRGVLLHVPIYHAKMKIWDVQKHVPPTQLLVSSIGTQEQNKFRSP